MKKIIFITLIICLLLSLPVSAARTDYVTDQAGVLTDSESTALNDKAADIAQKRGCEVLVYVMESDLCDEMDEAAAYYDDNGFGVGADSSGLLFLLNMGEREYAVYSRGYADTAFTDYGIGTMLDNDVLPLLKEDKFNDAFSAYLKKCDSYLAKALDGNVVDQDNDSEPLPLAAKAGIVVIIPVLIALGVCMAFKAQMKSAVSQRKADNYIPGDGVNVPGRRDTFTHRTESRVRIQTSSSSSGGSSSGGGYSAGRTGKF